MTKDHYIIKIAAYMKRRVKALRYVHRETLLKWLTWHDYHKSLAWSEENGKIKSAGVARPLNSDSLRLDFYEFNEGAELIYADQAASESPKDFAVLIETMKQRFPYAKTFMYKHCKTGRIRSWNLSRFHGVTQLKGKA